MAGRIILGIANPALDSNGQVDSGATLTFYRNGTTTLQSIYTSSTLLTPLTNPLPCDAAGRFPQIWSDNSKIFSVKWSPSGASPITYDDVIPSGSPDVGTYTPTDLSGGSLTFTTATGLYFSIGKLIWFSGRVDFPVTADTHFANISFGNLPAVKNLDSAFSPFSIQSNITPILQGVTNKSAASFLVYQAGTNTQVTNAALSGTTIRFSGMYVTD